MDAGIQARERLIEEGYDGLNNDNEEYIAFESNQIKSVYNRGKFDSSNPNILYQLSPEYVRENFDYPSRIPEDKLDKLQTAKRLIEKNNAWPR